MKRKMFMLVAVMIAVIAASCGKQAPPPVGGNYYYSTFANAKIAAEISGKAMVLDFYTDW